MNDFGNLHIIKKYQVFSNGKVNVIQLDTVSPVIFVSDKVLTISIYIII